MNDELKVAVWADGTWCYTDAIDRTMRDLGLSDDYEVITYAELEYNTDMYRALFDSP